MDTPKFVFLCGTPFVFFLSSLLLIAFWNREIVRLAGLYAILPGLNWSVITIISPWIDFKQAVIISAIIGLVFIIPIVYLFRKFYRMGFAVPWVLMVFEMFRSILLILYGLSSRTKLTYFEADLYYFYYFVHLAILIYCIFHRNQSNEIRQNAN